MTYPVRCPTTLRGGSNSCASASIPASIRWCGALLCAAWELLLARVRPVPPERPDSDCPVRRGEDGTGTLALSYCAWIGRICSWCRTPALRTPTSAWRTAHHITTRPQIALTLTMTPLWRSRIRGTATPPCYYSKGSTRKSFRSALGTRQPA